MSTAINNKNSLRRRIGFGPAIVCVVLGLGISGLGSSAFGADAAPTFREVVERNFAKWDTNHDGTLSATEIDSLVRDPTVTGDDAAAVAAIHRYLRGFDAPSTVTTTDLYQASADATVRHDVDDHRPRFAADFAAFRRHLLLAPRKILDNSADVTLKGVRQGRLGDCFFVSTLGAVIEREPKSIHEMLRVNPDGSSDVTFPGAETVRVKPLTEAEIALTSTAGKQGLWINVVERAFAEVMLKSPKVRRKTNDIELDVISRAGSARRAITVLTGHEARLTSIRKPKTPLAPPTDEELPALRARLSRLFVRSFDDGLLMSAVTPASGKLPPGIATHHVFAIMGFDETTETVYLWNPWGNRFQPKNQPAGLENGYPVQDGKFAMPLDDFLMVFRGVCNEVPAQSRGI